MFWLASAEPLGEVANFGGVGDHRETPCRPSPPARPRRKR